MGEIADMMVEGFLDEETGEIIDGESPGYPRCKRLMGIQDTLFACRKCGKKFKTEQGVKDHTRAKH